MFLPEPLHVNPTYFKLTLADGSAYVIDSNTYTSSLNSFQAASNVQPGEKVTGDIVFQVPVNGNPLKLTYSDFDDNRGTINL